MTIYKKLIIILLIVLVHKTSEAGSRPVLSWVDDYLKQELDGVSPKLGVSGTDFNFQVKYTDLDNDPPVDSEIWIDFNEDGDYSAAEKNLLIEISNSDQDLKDGKIYYFNKIIILDDDKTGGIKYQFYFRDKDGVAIGNPSQPNYFQITPAPSRNAPTLDFNTNLGVSPVVGEGGEEYQFLVTYKDMDNNAPVKKEVWIDLDDNETFELNEKFIMTKGIEHDYIDGKTYSFAKNLFFTGDGKIKFKYFFNDGGFDATGVPTVDGSPNFVQLNPLGSIPRLESVVNNPAGFTPETGHAGITDFTFKVIYFDQDNFSPVKSQVWLDLDNNGTYAEKTENFDLMEEDSNDIKYDDGKIYLLTTKILPVPPENTSIKYRFYFRGEKNVAVGDPSQTKTLTLIENHPPQLEFIGEDKGASSAAGEADNTFVFQVKYTDMDGDSPLLAQVWVDLNDDTSFDDKKEKFVLTENASSGADYKAGKIFNKTINLLFQEKERVNYSFYFIDAGNVVAIGDPTKNNLLTLTPKKLSDNDYLGSDDNNKRKCFVATAAYGSALAPQVVLLREFRDIYLPQSLINFYYNYSPPFANFLARHNFLRGLVRIGLLPLIGISFLLLKTSVMQKVIISLILIILGVCGEIYIRRYCKTFRR